MRAAITGVLVGGLAGVFGSQYIDDKIDEKNCAESHWDCSYNLTRSANMTGAAYFDQELDRLQTILGVTEDNPVTGCASWLVTGFASVTADMRLIDEFAYQNVVDDDYSSIFQPMPRGEIGALLEKTSYENPSFFECPVPEAFQERMRDAIPAFVEGIKFMSPNR